MRELFDDISLADPAFYKSGPIDVLLGVDLALPLLKGQTLSLGKDKPFAIRSELDWIIGGKANSSGQNSFHVNHIQLVSDHFINKFWELDSVPCAKPLTSLEEACENHFVKTHSRDENGRYTVKLPFHTPPTRLVPVLSTRTLRQLAIDEQENYPAASRATLSHFYVDDLLSGNATKKGAIQLVSELQEMMKRGGFSLRKWVSNDPYVLATIPEELKAVDSKHTIKVDQPVKILEIAWLPDVDKFTFTITVNETDVWTKRKVLSEVAKIFDPWAGWHHQLSFLKSSSKSYGVTI
ncbi:uncharacterized protein TNCV_2483521 [Trichonephila clavipes]|uniref:Peptidase aspartic putative domain-containing protein n=1 Tax=Trichonephila clavipes TaxID=2585209 RepID=A0A8X7BAN3_TRICX|nr:uncharacterized protein TNCV_2483521 [Trichonephila clavipes]